MKTQKTMENGKTKDRNSKSLMFNKWETSWFSIISTANDNLRAMAKGPPGRSRSPG